MAQGVLVVGAEIGEIQRVLPVLQRADRSVRHVGLCKEAAAAVKAEPFGLIIARVSPGDPGLDGLVEAVRAPGSPSLAAGLILVTDPGREREFGRYVGHGVNHLVPADALEARLPSAVGELLGVAARESVRVAAQLELRMRFGTSRTRVTTQNISASGMLLQGGREYPLGTLLLFELALPGALMRIRGELRVIRHVSATHDNREGIGVKFVSFTADGQERLTAFLHSQGA